MAAEIGILRPPSEARSLLVRLVRNCPWNKCTFCPAYKGQKFSLRKTEEVISDLDEFKAMVAQKEANTDFDLGPLHMWWRAKMRTAFLQDADALIAPVEQVVAVVAAMKERFPTLERITSYARANTLCHRSVDDLKKMKAAGLTRIHIGIETGADEVLEFVRKGVTHEKQKRACLRVKEAGLELCCYIMPGLGGRKFSRVHAEESGRLIAEVEPDHTRLRTCYVLEGTELVEIFNAGNYEIQDDEAVVREIRLFLSQFAHRQTNLLSDHRINLLLELNGRLPDESERLFSIIDGFLNFSPEDKELFIAGRRSGRLRFLDDMEKPAMREKLRKIMKEQDFSRQSPGSYLL